VHPRCVPSKNRFGPTIGQRQRVGSRQVPTRAGVSQLRPLARVRSPCSTPSRCATLRSILGFAAGGGIVNAVGDSTDRAPEQDLRSGIERRAYTRRKEFESSLTPPVGAVSSERRSGERRTADRRVAQLAASGLPQLFCPDCRGPLEFEAKLSWHLPAAYTVDAGYCPACSRRFLRDRATGDYESLSWTPLCRWCREPVGGARTTEDAAFVTYHCQAHPAEEWRYAPLTDRWTACAPVGLSH
jgi:hypothetical protein